VILLGRKKSTFYLLINTFIVRTKDAIDQQKGKMGKRGEMAQTMYAHVNK
jgi:hypothetical protein